MPDIKHHFAGGKMNKDTDERLVPNGEYRDAMNIQVSTSEDSDVGTAQNLLGNMKLAGSEKILGSANTCIGSISDEKNDVFYWFITDDDFSSVFSGENPETVIVNGGHWNGDLVWPNTYNQIGGQTQQIMSLSATKWGSSLYKQRYDSIYMFDKKLDSPVITPVLVDEAATLVVLQDGEQNQINSQTQLNLAVNSWDPGSGTIQPTPAIGFLAQGIGYSATGDARAFEIYAAEKINIGDQLEMWGINPWTGQPQNFLENYKKITVINKSVVNVWTDTNGDSHEHSILRFSGPIGDFMWDEIAQSIIPTSQLSQGFVIYLPYIISHMNFVSGVLNFSSDRLITGVNIIDDMMFWTDNHTEPKKINIPRSIAGTDPMGTSHTLLVSEPREINTVSNPTPIREEHITVIKQSPKSPPSCLPFTEREQDVNYGGVFSISTINTPQNSDFIGSSATAGVFDFSALDVDDIFKIKIPIDINGNSNFELTDWEVGSKVVIKEFDDAGNPPFTPITSYRIKGTIVPWWDPNVYQPTQGNWFTSDSGIPQEARAAIRIDSIDGNPPPVVPGQVLRQYVIELFDETEKLFEFKFPRFSHRYKYEDGEYSTFAPFTEVCFVAGNFDYHPKKGYNLGMVNRLTSVRIQNIIPADIPDDVIAVDVLYKEDTNPNVYVVDTIKPQDERLIDVDGIKYNNWELNYYEVTKENISRVVKGNQLLRPWDNVPRKALAQEITGNRIVYGNYLQNYNLTPYGDESLNVYKPDFKHDIGNYEDGVKSIKSLREYQIGVVFTDVYGRETPVITNDTGTFKIEKGLSNQANRLKVGFKGGDNMLPNDIVFFKFFIKETSGEYYNLAMDRWYDAEDGNVWLSFPSVDRNKVDIDTFLILKKPQNSSNLVVEPARYKILAIENEAPDFIKTVKNNIGEVTHDMSFLPNPKDVYGNTSDFGPVLGKNFFRLNLDNNEQILQTSLANLQDIKNDLYVEFRIDGSDAVSNRYKINKIEKIEDGATPGDFLHYAVTIDDQFGDDVNFIVDDPLAPNEMKDLLITTFYEYKVENLPEFDGRFFVKIYSDSIFDTHINNNTVLSNKYTTVNSQKIYYMSSDFDDRHLGNSADFNNCEIYAGVTNNDPSPGQYYSANYNDKFMSFLAYYQGTSTRAYPAFTGSDDHLMTVGYIVDSVDEFASLPHYGSNAWWPTTDPNYNYEIVVHIDEGPYKGTQTHDHFHWEADDETAGEGIGVQNFVTQGRMDIAIGPIRSRPTNVSGQVNTSVILGQATNQASSGTGGQEETNFAIVEGPNSDFNYVGDETFWNITSDARSNTYGPFAEFLDSLASGTKFTWQNDPTETVYTVWKQTEFTNRNNYRNTNTFDVHTVTKNQTFLHSQYNFRKQYRFYFFPPMTAWNPIGDGSPGAISGSFRIDEVYNAVGNTNLTASASFTNANSISIASTDFLSTYDSEYLQVRNITQDLILTKIGSTTLTEPPLVKDVQVVGTDHVIEFCGYNDNDVSISGSASDKLVFEQPKMNGFSPNSARNINNYTASGKTGVKAIGYNIEIVSQLADEAPLPTDPAIWETEPKENTDLDIYYEASGSNPITLDVDTIQTALPVGSTVQFVNGAGGVSDAVTIVANSGSQPLPFLGTTLGNIIQLSEPFCAEPGGTCPANTVFSSQESVGVVYGDIIKVTRPDGSTINVEIEGVHNFLTQSPFTADAMVIDNFLYNGWYGLNYFNCYSFKNGVESNRIRDNFNLPFIAKGVKASTTLDEPYKEERRKYGLIFSGVYNSTSGINETNQFIQAEKITKDINPIYGSIQKLHSRDTDLVTLCEDKILKILANKDAVFNADGNPQLTSNERVLGQTVPFVGEYGISKNPESFASESYRVYFADKVRGAILRLSMDGLTPISDHGMKDWFRDNLKLSNTILGSYDDKKDEYNVTIDNSVDGTPKTLSFREDVKGWVSFKSFIPEHAVSCANDYYTFLNALPYQHHSELVDRNTFYGTYTNSHVNVLINDMPGSVKSYTTINYEGSVSRITQNLEDDQYFNLQPRKGWWVENLETNKETGNLYEFIEKEGKWFNYIRGQETLVSYNGIDSHIIMNDENSSYWDQASFAIQGLGILGQTPIEVQVSGCTEVGAFNYNPDATIDDGSCIPTLMGCLDPSASNYYPQANTDDGTCVWFGCTCNPNDFPDGCVNTTTFPPQAYDIQDDGTCIAIVPGCTDPNALNYNAAANQEDDSCNYPVDGCTMSTANNYDPLATNDNGTCIWYGCTNPNSSDYGLTDNNTGTNIPWPAEAMNYITFNPNFGIQDNGTCGDGGCTNSTAPNYDPNASYDDGTCFDCGFLTTPNATTGYNGVPFEIFTSDASFNVNNGQIAIHTANYPGVFLSNWDTGGIQYTVTDSNGVNIVGVGASFTMYQTIGGIAQSQSILFHDLPPDTYTIEMQYLDAPYLSTNGPCTLTYTATVSQGGPPPVLGCTDSTACNYNALATVDNQTCEWTSCSGCMDPIATNYSTQNNFPTIPSSNPNQLIPCKLAGNVNTNAGCTIFCGDGTSNINGTPSNSCCNYQVLGCWDSSANNTSPIPAYCSQGTCNFIDDGSCDFCIYGCTDNTTPNPDGSFGASNYDPAATCDDGSCVYPSAPPTPLCTDPTACNYNPNAQFDCLGNDINDPSYTQGVGWNSTPCCLWKIHFENIGSPHNVGTGEPIHFEDGSNNPTEKHFVNLQNPGPTWDPATGLPVQFGVGSIKDQGLSYKVVRPDMYANTTASNVALTVELWKRTTDGTGSSAQQSWSQVDIMEWSGATVATWNQFAVNNSYVYGNRFNDFPPYPWTTTANFPSAIQQNGSSNYEFEVYYPNVGPYQSSDRVQYFVTVYQTYDGNHFGKGTPSGYSSTATSLPNVSLYGSTASCGVQNHFKFHVEPCANNPSATVGCTDQQACNYDVYATCDDGSCIYSSPNWTCMDPGQPCIQCQPNTACTSNMMTCQTWNNATPAGLAGQYPNQTDCHAATGCNATN